MSSAFVLQRTWGLWVATVPWPEMVWMPLGVFEKLIDDGAVESPEVNGVEIVSEPVVRFTCVNGCARYRVVWNTDEVVVAELADESPVWKRPPVRVVDFEGMPS